MSVMDLRDTMQSMPVVGAKSDPPRDEEVARTLRRGRKGKRWWIIGGVTLMLLGGLGGWRALAHDAPGPSYKTARTERGKLAVTVSATGRIEALETVDVGAEVSGRILSVHVDFNDRVKEGQLLAELDTERLVARVDEGSAQLGVARADAERSQIELARAEQEHERAKGLYAQGVASRQRLEEVTAEAARARASLSGAHARARVASASLKAAGSDVGRARIVAPIDGVVLARNVEPGQTLASSFQVPVLFKLARDLKHMKLLVGVDEADVGRVRRGQHASFTVEAYPGRSFRSRVVSVHNMPTIEEGVVSYQAVLEVDNGDLSLRPGMTATATIVTDELDDVLLVPNAALRFVPPEEAKKLREHSEDDERPTDPGELRHMVWTLRDGEPQKIALAIGRSDGTKSEVKGGEIEPGLELLVDVEEKNP